MPIRHAYSIVASTLGYDPDTGAFRWLGERQGVTYSRPPGYLTPAGELMISVRGKQYPAKQLAWLLGYGHWPDRPITFRSLETATTPAERNAARLDFRLSNLCLYMPPPSDRTSRAKALQERQNRLSDEHNLPRYIKGFPQIIWSKTEQRWVVREDERLAHRIKAARKNHEIGRTIDPAEAIEVYEEHTRRCQYVHKNPPPKLTPHEAAITTGKGHTLEELTRHMLYNPDTGDFLARTGNRAGMRIDRPKDPVYPDGVRVVPYLDAIYYARNLAWFLHYYHWPVPREITYVDHTRRDDVSIANLTRAAKAPQDSAN